MLRTILEYAFIVIFGSLALLNAAHGFWLMVNL